MRLNSIELRTTPDHVRLIGHVACRSPDHKVVPWAISESHFTELAQSEKGIEIYFEFPRRYEEFVSLTADAFAIALLLPSMAAGEPLEIVPPVSELLLFNLTGVRDIFHTWYPQFERAPIVATPRIEPRQPMASRAASFFSGGVDSFYTLLKRKNHDPLSAPLTHIIFMHGVEQRLDESAGTDQSQQHAEQVAARIGIECVAGKTNLRTIFPLHWERYYVGSALAAIAVALSRGFGYVCIPSSNTYGVQITTGTTPLVDERFSTETIRIVHDGSEVSRAEKTASIVKWDQALVLENLRVCFENAGGAFNCGKCYKCVRTATALKALGLWEQASAFPDKSTSHWRKVWSEDHLDYTIENLKFAREQGDNRELIEELEKIVRKQNRYTALATYLKNSPLECLLPTYRRIRQWAGGEPRTH